MRKTETYASELPSDTISILWPSFLIAVVIDMLGTSPKSEPLEGTITPFRAMFMEVAYHEIDIALHPFAVTFRLGFLSFHETRVECFKMMNEGYDLLVDELLLRVRGKVGLGVSYGQHGMYNMQRRFVKISISNSTACPSRAQSLQTKQKYIVDCGQGFIPFWALGYSTIDMIVCVVNSLNLFVCIIILLEYGTIYVK